MTAIRRACPALNSVGCSIATRTPMTSRKAREPAEGQEQGVRGTTAASRKPREKAWAALLTWVGE